MTKLRIIGAWLCVLYVIATCCVGIWHDHHDQDSREHCSACAWAVSAIANLAIPEVEPVVASLNVSTPVAPSFVFIVTPVLCNTASRAPPLAPA